MGIGGLNVSEELMKFQVVFCSSRRRDKSVLKAVVREWLLGGKE